MTRQTLTLRAVAVDSTFEAAALFADSFPQLDMVEALNWEDHEGIEFLTLDEAGLEEDSVDLDYEGVPAMIAWLNDGDDSRYEAY